MHQGSDPKINIQVPKNATTRGGGALSGGSMLLQKMLKIRCPRFKNAFAIQHLLHHSIVYTFIHYHTIRMDALIIAFLRSYVQYR